MQLDPKKLREEREKEITSRYWELRKRSLRFFFLNVLIVLAFFAFVFYARQVTPATYSSIVDSLQLVVEMSKLEYLAPENISAKIYIVNTTRRERDFVVSDFSVKVYNDERTVYEFSYGSPVRGNVASLGKRLVFELGKDVAIGGMPSGSYRVQATCKVNGKPVTTVRNFQYIEELVLSALTEAFYLIGEHIKPSALLVNRTADTKTVGVGKLEWRAFGQAFVQSVGRTFKLMPTESVVLESERTLTATTKGTHELSVLIFFDDGKIKETRVPLHITDRYEETTGNLDVNLETDELVVAGAAPRVRVTLSNSINRQRYIKLDAASISVPEVGYNLNVGARRVALPPFGRSTLTLLQGLRFQQPGVYDVIVTLVSGKSTLSRKLKIAVAN